MMKFLIPYLSVLFSMVVPAPALATERPNVVIIYTDDQGSVDLNSYGSKDLQTPHMDRIAEGGIRFTQFYASPICSPSRASLLTGMSPQRAGLPGNATSQPHGESGLPAEAYTMAELFKDAGYRTAQIGKWHLGTRADMQPGSQGFDYSFGHLGGCIDNYSHFFYWKGPNRHDLYENGIEVQMGGEFFPDLMVDEANKFIKSNQEKPFFLYLAFNMPHYPYQGDPAWLDYYQKQGLAYPRNLYAAFLSTLDDKIGEVLNTLDHLELREKTIIIFQSDNGHSTEERAHHGGGSAGPFRGAKQCLFEGGIRVPAAIQWPGKIPPGEVRDQFAVNTDWLPTLAELCDISLDTSGLDGRSLVPILKDASRESLHPQGYCWAFKDMWAVRRGKWKLLGNPYDTSMRDYEFEEKLFLVNLEEDPGERKNLANDFPEIVSELEQQYSHWLKNLKP